jgi:DNA-binding transcriptional ArsR family regulator
MSEIYEKFFEEEKRKYVVKLLDNNSRLVIEEIYYPIYPCGNYVKTIYEVEDSFDELTLEIREVRESWNGTGSGTIFSLSLPAIEEVPWFLDEDELREEIEKSGIKETIKEILDYFKDVTVDNIEALKFELEW